MEGLSAYENGGKGSGNFGHAGRPGEIGGSASSGRGSSSVGSKSERKGRSKEEQIDEQFEKGLITQSERDELKAQAKEARKTPSGQDAMKWARENKEIYDHSNLKSDEMSFDDILRSMYDGQDFYQTTGVQDSIDREKFFDEISKRTGLDYDDVYATWIHGSKVDLDPSNVNYEPDTKSVKKVAKYLKGLRKKNSFGEILTDTIMKTLNGGKGSGNFGHAGRPGEVGGSASSGGGMNPNTKIAKDVSKRKEVIEKAKQVTKDIEDRIGQKMKEGETYTALDEAKFSRFKFFHGEDGTEYTYDKVADTITKTNPKTGDQEVVTKQKDKGFQSEHKVGDSYTKGGVTYDVVDGKNGPMAVSKDGKINTELPDKLRHDQTKMIKDTFDGMRDEGVPMSSPRYQAARDTYKRIQERAIETSRKGLDASKAPKMVREEVDRFLKQIETTGSSESVKAYYKTASGILDGWAKGNGGLNKPQSSQIKGEIKELKAELDSLYERYRIMTTPKGFRK